MRHAGLFQAEGRFETLYGGRTNRVWRLHGSGDDLVLKLYRSDVDNPLFRNDPRLEAACLEHLSGSGLAPRLRASGQFGRTAWVLYDHAPGSPWREDPRPAARILKHVHAFAPVPDAPPGWNGSADLQRHAEAILALCPADQGRRLSALRPAHARVPRGPTCLVHGDPVAGNLLVSHAGAVLIDWQCPATGDPAEDLAIFLSPAMQQVYRGFPLTAADEEQFLGHYDQPEVVARYRALKPWFHWRMAAYCLWRSCNGAPDYADALKQEWAALLDC